MMPKNKCDLKNGQSRVVSKHLFVQIGFWNGYRFLIVFQAGWGWEIMLWAPNYFLVTYMQGTIMRSKECCRKLDMYLQWSKGGRKIPYKVFKLWCKNLSRASKRHGTSQAQQFLTMIDWWQVSKSKFASAYLDHLFFRTTFSYKSWCTLMHVRRRILPWNSSTDYALNFTETQERLPCMTCASQNLRL